uniref:Uncharacterized protein n=1 Tax=viral metagenome TaxID=1070528 RepID=A0A6M3IUN3_9ZZZZ
MNAGLRAVLERSRKWLEYLDDPEAEVPPPEPEWTKFPDGSLEETDQVVLRETAAALSTALERMEGLEQVRDEAEAHRLDYYLRSQTIGASEEPRAYWRGRMDEAGHLRDRLVAALAQEKREAGHG